MLSLLQLIISPSAYTLYTKACLLKQNILEQVYFDKLVKPFFFLQFFLL